jgi:hypothetical protein
LSHYKLTAGAGLILLALSAYAGVLLLEGRFWTPFFGAQSSSVIFFSLVFLGVGALLARRGVPDVEAFSTALATTLSSIWLYELIYHYSFASYFDYFHYPFFDANDTNTLLLDGATSLLVLVGYKHIKVRGNYCFGLLILAFSALYAGWLLIGFPQYTGAFELPQFIKVDNPFLIGYLLNRLSKLSLCLAWVALYSRPKVQESDGSAAAAAPPN